MFAGVFRRATKVVPHHLVILGSSSSEALDYVMGPNRSYHPFWASGWSARGLRTQDTKQYVLEILRPLPRASHILLNFGTTDVLFNAQHKARMGFFNFSRFLDEAADGIVSLSGMLTNAGYSSVSAAFLAPVAVMPAGYWQRRTGKHQLPDAMLGNMYHALFARVAKQIPTIDTFAEMSKGAEGSYLLQDDFHRQKTNTHPDYVKMITILEGKLRNLPGLPEFRATRHVEHYKHVPCHIKTLLSARTTRPNTCC